MKKKLEKYGYLDNAKAVDPKRLDPLLRSQSEYYTKCIPDNIYGKSIPQSPYLWPIIPLAPNNYRYISPAEFLHNAQAGTLTLDEIFMFTMVHDINVSDDDGYTALLLAVRNGKIDTATMLLEQGVDVNQTIEDYDGWTALNIACLNDNIEMATMLLRWNANINTKESDMTTTLMTIAEEGNTHMVRFLLDHHAKVDLERDDGKTALMLACEKGHTETAALLINRGRANVNHEDNIGMTALMLACENGHTETAELLLRHRANVNQAAMSKWEHLTQRRGTTALIVACQNGHAETAELLLNHGANVIHADNEGNTAMSLAIQNGHVDIANMLRSRL